MSKTGVIDGGKMDDKDVKSKKQNISLGRAMLILEKMVSYRKPMRLLDIANDSGLSSSTVYRFLNAFIECGYVKRNDEAQTYSLTLKLAEIGYYCMNNYQLTDNLHEYVERISRHFQETASLCVENNMQVVYLDCVENSNRLLSSNVRIGKVVPMHCTAEGKIFLTEYSEEKLRILQERRLFYKFTENTICDLDDLKRELEETMKRGFAWSKEEHEVGFKTLAVPVRSYTGQIIATISLSCPIQRLQDEKEAVLFMKNIAKESSRALGFRGMP